MTDIRMSLQEAGTLLGIAPNSVRSRFKAGKIRGERDNSGKIWVWLDPDALPSLEPSIEPHSKPSIEGSKDGQIKALEAHVQTLAQELAAARAEVETLRPQAVRAGLLEVEIEGARKLLSMQEAMTRQSDQQRDEYREEAKRTLQRLIEMTEAAESRRGFLSWLRSPRKSRAS